ncbi:PRC-barrel domain-containing protein [Streptomyces sp. NBC_00557]|uniref:PRC-barrel domain-containing protein n=1 Tax=Streptomyces sp. NBC_00557 TaxID=2975776 RepID=UPI002E816473|nr:PRC-barrel domain-containing protein [Streptomyces sp. NBC_00557]WUC32876.1 PRC-barrel domain-containing protein [Streptomyces sp. NBC_00557]
MNTLMLASELTGRVVVTLGGEAVAQIRDTVFDAQAGRIKGFTLSGRGLLSGPLKESLPFSGVHAIGPSAVMIPSEAVLENRDVVVGTGEADRGQVIGAPVLTDQGTEVGTVLDVVIEAGVGGRVIGFEIAAHENLDSRKRKTFIPRGETLAVSGRALVVPADAGRFVADDLPSFSAQVEAFRAQAVQPCAGAPTAGEGGPA